MNDGIRTVDNTRMTPPTHYLAQDVAHKRKCEFAVKAGYRWDQAEAVLLAKPDATEDEILAKLVHLSARASPTPKSRSFSSIRFGGEPPPPTPPPGDTSCLRPIVVDGSNVAMKHGNGNFFSCQGILLAVQYFRDRGHQEITVFVPSWRKEASKPDSPITDQDILLQLEKAGQLVFTPSKRIGEKRIVCYDDRFIVKLATTNRGVIVSNDNYRDLLNESDAWRETIEKRVLMFAFVKDLFMVPDDPYGRNGPTLEQLLKFDTSPPPPKGQAAHKQSGKICPYADKCTFGKKCRFYHPEREETNSSSKVGSNGTSTPSTEQKLSHSSHSRANSTEDLLSTTKAQSEYYVGPGAIPAHPSRNLDISEIEEKLSALSIVPDLHTPEVEQGTSNYFSSNSLERKFIHSMPPLQASEHSGYRCSSAVQMPLHDVPLVTTAKRFTYPIAQPTGHQSKLVLDPVVYTPAQVGAMGNTPEHLRSSHMPSQPTRRDMNGQLLSRGVASEAVHVPLQSQLMPPQHSPGYSPAQYRNRDRQLQSPVHFRELGIHYLQTPQQYANYGCPQDPYNRTYYTSPTDTSPPDLSCYPLYVERDNQSVHQSNLYGRVLARLGPEYCNKIMKFMQLYPHVQNVEDIVEYILRNHNL